MNGKNEVSSYLENISLLLWGIFLLAFPLIFTTSVTDPFALPKHVLLGAVTLITLFLFGAKMISDGKVILRRTPFDLPLILFAVFSLASSLFAVNRLESLIALTPLLFAIVLYFVIVNTVKSESSLTFLLTTLVVGACVVTLISVTSYFKIYFLPSQSTQLQTFNTFGSLLDQALYLAFVLPIAGYFTLPILETKEIGKVAGKSFAFAFAFIVVGVGLAFTLYELIAVQKPLILPFETGFQTAFAAISQDAGRIAQGFFFGSGFGTYATDFTRFKQAAYNLNQDLWAFTFFRSSSFVLELLATTGVLGLGAFLFLIIKIFKEEETRRMRKNVAALSLAPAIISAFILPFSPVIVSLPFVLLALFSVAQGLDGRLSHRFFDVELHFVAFKKSLIPLSMAPVEERVSSQERSLTKFLPVTFLLLFTAFSGILGFFIVRFVASDVIFQSSLVSAAQNKGLETYNQQVNAIQLFPYRDAYHRIYSQTNLALANSLAAQQPKGTTPNQQVQQTITTLIQQSINAGRTAVTLSPQSVLNWQNLSSIYRSMIGFGQNAQEFAIVSQQQAVFLNPNNPQEYLNLGGIYYQLSQWENAQRQFQIAVNLKPDFSNAYYNLGHALENKGDLQNALVQYETVKTLIANDPENSKKIDAEIAALKAKAGSGENAQAAPSKQNQQQAQTGQNQQPLGISTPQTQLPEKKPQEVIPPPTAVSPTAEPTTSPSSSSTITP